MQIKALALVFGAAASFVAAQDIDDNDVPSACRSVCRSTVDLTTRCDRENDDDDSGYINCVCSASDASNFVPQCEACVAANDEADNDVRDIVRSCSFSTATYNSASSFTSVSAPTGTPSGRPSLSGDASITGVETATAITTDSSLPASSTTGSTATRTSGGSGATQTSAASATGATSTGSAASQASGAAAPVVAAATAGFGGLAVAMLVVPIIL